MALSEHDLQTVFDTTSELAGDTRCAQAFPSHARATCSNAGGRWTAPFEPCNCQEAGMDSGAAFKAAMVRVDSVLDDLKAGRSGSC